MFNSSLYARRVRRIVFGAILFAGTGVLVVRAHHDEAFHAARILLATWVVAACGGLVASAAVRRSKRDPGPLFGPSMVVPAIGIALLGPLTLQLPIVILTSGIDAFDAWVKLSIYITGIAHIAFAFMLADRALGLIRERPTFTPRTIHHVIIVVSAIPFAVFYLIPPILVALTGLPFRPLMRHMETFIERERVPDRLPRATAMRVA